MTPARDDRGGTQEPRRRHGLAETVPTSPRARVPERSRFRFPVGIDMIEGENYRQREGYDVIYLEDDDSPRYQYTVAAGADRTAEVFRALAGLLSEEVRVVLEIPGRLPGSDEGDGEVCEVWTSGPVPSRALLAAFDSHERLFVHDGMVGLGAVSRDGTTEIFLDEHKLMYFHAPEMDAADAVLAGLGLAARRSVRHFSELSHVHTSLASKGAGEPYRKVAEELKGTLGLEWEETKEYS